MPDNHSILYDKSVTGHSLTSFEENYIALREKEGRLFTDDELLLLPDTGQNHPHYTEWQLRKQSAQRLKKYLLQKKKGLKILEIGCGNGWLSHLLAAIPDSTITGIDINKTELQQAIKVFSNRPNLQFKEGADYTTILKHTEPDIIILAASVQYFPSLTDVLNTLLSLLKHGCEIHLLDTYFYDRKQKEEAVERSVLYFKKMGFPEMGRYYFHHTWKELNTFSYKELYSPSSLLNRFRKAKNPFPWICITKK